MENEVVTYPKREMNLYHMVHFSMDEVKRMVLKHQVELLKNEEFAKSVINDPSLLIGLGDHFMSIYEWFIDSYSDIFKTESEIVAHIFKDNRLFLILKKQEIKQMVVEQDGHTIQYLLPETK